MKIIKYTRSLEAKLTNVASLPRGLKCKYLLCLIDHKGNYIAKSWHRVKPQADSGHVLIKF